MTFLFYLLATLLSLGQLGRISFFDQQINIYLFEPIILILTILLLFKSKKEIFTSLLFKSFFAFLCICTLSFFISASQFNQFQNTVALLYFGRLTMYLLFLILIIKNQLHQYLNKSIRIILVLTPVFSLGQYFLYPDLRNLYYLGWDPHLSRIFGLYFDSTITGAIMVILFFWLLFQQFSKKWLKYGLLMLYFLLILLTYSRISYLGFLFGIVLLVLQKITIKKIVLLISICLFFIGALFLLPRPNGESVRLERLVTISARIEDYKQGLLLFIKKPILGYGYDHLRYVRNVKVSSHASSNFSSSYLTLLVSVGLIGFIFFILFLFTIFKTIPFQSSILFAIVAFISFFDNILLTNFILILVTLVIGSFKNKKTKKLN